MLVANRKNLKTYAEDLLGVEYTPENEKKLIDLCTKKTVNDYHDGYSHKSFATRDWLADIDKVLNTHGVEGFQLDNDDLLTNEKVVQYCNAGDPYVCTIIYWNNKLRIGCWGDLVEKFDTSRN